MVLNDGDSIISFLSSLRYWLAFKVERACQSYFGCVSCISGPLGLYRNAVLQQYLNLWSDQKFLGSVCTFGDDRHLTNRMLQFGYATKYTPHAVCHTETPSQYLRWLNQQIRWSKSFFREWLFNALWWHKHHPWMTYESILAGFFPYFVTGTGTWSRSRTKMAPITARRKRLAATTARTTPMLPVEIASAAASFPTSRWIPLQAGRRFCSGAKSRCV